MGYLVHNSLLKLTPMVNWEAKREGCPKAPNINYLEKGMARLEASPAKKWKREGICLPIISLVYGCSC